MFVDREGIIDSRRDELLGYTLETFVCVVLKHFRASKYYKSLIRFIKSRRGLRIQLGKYMKIYETC